MTAAMLRSVCCLMAFAALTGCGEAPAPVPMAPVSEPAYMVRSSEMFRDDEGKACNPLTADGRKATVLIFLMHDCPVGNATAPELARIAAAFAPQGIRFYGVYATETAAEITAHRKDYRLPFPGLLDPKLQLARLTGATRAPEATVLSADGELLYRGRIDDRAVQPGIMKPVPQQRDLYLALTAIIEGRQPEQRFTEAIGCYLPET